MPCSHWEEEEEVIIPVKWLREPFAAVEEQWHRRAVVAAVLHQTATAMGTLCD